MGIDAGESLGHIGLKAVSRNDRDILDGPQRMDEDSDTDSLEADIDRELQEEDRLEALRAVNGPAQYTQVQRFRGEDDYDDIDIDVDDEIVDPNNIVTHQEGYDFERQEDGMAQDWDGASDDDRFDEILGLPRLPAFGQQQQQRNLDVSALFPGFERGAILDFTDYTASRPRKRARLSKGTIQCAFLTVPCDLWKI